MIRKLLGIGALVAVSTNLGVVLSTAGVAGAVPPPATGTAICKIASGSGTLTPGLSSTGSPGGVKIKFTATMVVGGSCGGSVTSPSGVTVNGGTVKGKGFYNPVPSTGNGSSCANFASSDIVGKIVVKVNWSVTGPAIANTKVVYKNNTGTVAGSGTDTVTLNAPSGTAVKSGSFTTPNNPHQLVLVTNIPGPTCGTGTFSTFSILPGSNISM
jgi:hypothetical protein